MKCVPLSRHGRSVVGRRTQRGGVNGGVISLSANQGIHGARVLGPMRRKSGCGLTRLYTVQLNSVQQTEVVNVELIKELSEEQQCQQENCSTDSKTDCSI